MTLWALGEIVKAQAGIHEQDPPAEAAAKVRRAVEAAVADAADVPWIESHLLALVGLAEESELGGDRRGEAFSAWRHFFEAMADRRSLVLVFEDLHWADESLLDFVDELVDWVTDVPLLVVGTARPELLERRPGWGGGTLNATTLALQPLSDEQTALLLGKLLQRPVLAAESQQALLERAGGNPLYAEQYAELYLERGSADELPLPETLQGIIAARLDGLPQAEKKLLHDAAVVGKVFWSGALRRDAQAAGAALHALERKGFVRRQRRTSVEGETEFAFAHALVRDVAYGQIARPDRVEKHRSTAEWIEGLGRPEDHAELLAHHWRSALELARASGGDDAVLVVRTRLALRNAGDRAFALNSYTVAAAQYEEALRLWPEDDEERPNLLFRRGRALYNAYDDRREQALDEARDALLAAGETELAAETEAFLALVSWVQGHGEAARAHLSRAEELAGDSVSASRARVLAVSARMHEIAGEHEDGKRIAESALEIAEALGLDELRAHALTTIGMAKNFLGDPSGLQDMERALELALEIDSPVASSIVNNLAVEALLAGNLTRTEALYGDALRIAERLGDAEGVRFIGANRIWNGYMRGRWDVALQGADAFIAECEAGSPHTNELGMRLVRGSIRRARGDADGALADHLHAVALARETADPLDLVLALLTCAASHAERGKLDEARALVDEAIPIIRETGLARGVVELVPFAESLNVRDALREAMEANPPPRDIPWHNAALLALRDELRDAADIFSATGNPTFEAGLRLYGGERLIESGRRREGEVELEKALAFYRSVGATFFIQRGERLLAKSA